MDSLIGLPSVYFSDVEMHGAFVRLLRDWSLGDGNKLKRGETFVVTGIKPGRRHERIFYLRNFRVLNVPVKALICELILPWPAKVEGNKPDGR